MVTDADREWMWKHYAPDPAMRLNLGIRRRLAALLDFNPKRIELAFNILFSLPGTPFIYYGDEIGMGDDISLFDRNGVRLPMPWDSSIQLEHANSLRTTVLDNLQDENSLWHKLRKLIQIRKSEPTFYINEVQMIECGDPRILCLVRQKDQQRVIIVHNLSSAEISMAIPSSLTTDNSYFDLLSQKQIDPLVDENNLQLQAFQSLYLQCR
jgi:maltose alpha-D-glucosyltransferase / alpha-amylase